MKDLRKIKVTNWLRLLLMLCLALSVMGCEDPFIATRYYYTRTDDNALLALRRYCQNEKDYTKYPVILCHGLSYNLMFWDIQDEISLARYLAEEGYDVWSLSLRGAAPSSQPFNSAVRKLGRFKLDREMFKTILRRVTDLNMSDWSVDDHIRHDVPAAIQFVRQQTEYEQVHWIGHSMGGMCMFAYLEEQAHKGPNGVKSFVAVAVPMSVEPPLSDPLDFLLRTQTALKVGSRIVGSSAPASWGVIFGDLGTPMDKLFYNSSNMDGGALRALHYWAEEEISMGQLTQLLNMVRAGSFLSLDESIDYTARLNQVNVSAYLLAGSVDNMATVASVKKTYRQIGAEDKAFRLFGRVNGYQNDYGHNDIVLGVNARKEVYPTILDWLNRFPYEPPAVKEGETKAQANEKLLITE